MAAWGRTRPPSGWPAPERRDNGIEPQSLDRTTAAWDERAIVDAVLAGDREAFRRLVERESVALVRACHRILGDRSDAEDAAQEALVTAYRQLASWRGDGPFGAWLDADRRPDRPAPGREAADRHLARSARRRSPRVRATDRRSDHAGDGPGRHRLGAAHRSRDALDARRARHRAPSRRHRPARALSRGGRAALLRRRDARRDRARDRTDRSAPSRRTSIAAWPGCAATSSEATDE